MNEARERRGLGTVRRCFLMDKGFEETEYIFCYAIDDCGIYSLFTGETIIDRISLGCLLFATEAQSTMMEDDNNDSEELH